MSLGSEQAVGAVLAYHDAGVAHLTLNRPEAMNAITVELGRQLENGLVRMADEPSVRVIVVGGAGGNFCVGGDFNEVERLRAGGTGDVGPLFERFGRACDVIAGLDVPVVAAVEGYAMAGGFELALASDIVLVSDDATLADNHVNFGQVPGGGSSQRLARIVGIQRALGLMLSGERLSGLEAVTWGLAYRSYPPGQFEAGVAGFAATLASKSPAAIGTIKRLVRTGTELPLAEGLDLERRTVADFISGHAGASGVEQFRSRGA